MVHLKASRTRPTPSACKNILERNSSVQLNSTFEPAVFQGIVCLTEEQQFSPWVIRTPTQQQNEQTSGSSWPLPKRRHHSFEAIWSWKKVEIQASVSPASKKIQLKGSKKYIGLKWISQCSGLELITLFPLYNVAADCYIISIVMFSLLTGANTLLIIILFEWSHSRKDDIGSCISLCHYACKDHLSLPRHTTSAIWG